VSPSTEELIRQALERQAERAVDPDRVRAALPRRAARRARRRYATVAAGAVAAAALAAFAVPVLALDDGGGTGQVAASNPPPPASTGATTPATPTAVALRYGPTWLPSGLVERSRSVPLGPGNPYDGPVRIWKRANTDPGVDMGGNRLEFAAIGLKDGANQFGDVGTPVDINGRPGRLSGSASDGKSYLHWLIDPQTVVFIHQVEMGLSDADMLRMARSVQPDPGQFQVPLRLDGLPAGMTPFRVEISGDSPGNWRLEASAIGAQPAGAASATGTEGKESKERASSSERWVYIRLGPTTDAPDGGESTVIGGRPARIAARPIDIPVPGEHTYVVVDLESGRKLTVYSLVPDVSRADLVAVAAGTVVGAAPDLSWLGH
jgi:hypothetical protein